MGAGTGWSGHDKMARSQGYGTYCPEALHVGTKQGRDVAIVVTFVTPIGCYF